jgi:hypothetical protein
MKHIELTTIGVFYGVAMTVLPTAIGTVPFGERLGVAEVVGILMGGGALVPLARFA